MDIMSQKITINRGNVTDERLLKALDMLEWAINELELREFITNFKNQYGIHGFLQTNETNAKILQRFVQGSENGTGVDFEWDFIIDFFTTGTGLIGYTEDGKVAINLNTTYLDRELPQVCNTLGHEFCHLVGMVHSFDNPGWTIWGQTAPYAIGQFIQYMVEKKMGLEAQPPFFPMVSRKRRVVYAIKRFFKRLFA
jgi:hypothetical protein